MPISDSHAERRNLIVLSAGIIIFYLADAELSSKDLSLPMVNLTVHDVDTLVIMLWSALFWFCFRYWQEARQDGNEKIRKALCRHPYRNHKSIERYIRSSFEGKQEVSISSLTYNAHGWTASYYKKRPDGTSINPNQKFNKTVTGFFGSWALFRAIISMSRSDGCVWSYWLPYLLFGIAIALGLSNFFQPDC